LRPAALAAGLLGDGQPLPGTVKPVTERDGVDYASSCAFLLAQRAGISAAAAAERICAAAEPAGWIDGVWAQNGYVNVSLGDGWYASAAELLAGEPLPVPSETAYPVPESERFRRDGGSPFYAVRYTRFRLETLIARYPSGDNAAPFSPRERQLLKQLCLVSAAIPEGTGDALFRQLARLSTRLLAYYRTGPLLSGSDGEKAACVRLLRAAERVLHRGMLRLRMDMEERSRE